MKKAFTMIELIYVIVIIGILAAIAIPKLSATRDDATLSAIVANTRTVIADMGAFYTSQGSIEWQGAKISHVTDVPLFTDTICLVPTVSTDEASEGTFYICDKSGGSAINAVTIETTDDGRVTVTSRGGSSLADSVAANKAMISLANSMNVGKTYILGGSSIFRD